ncbi:fosfomycin resistance glutathione transferase [Thalassomonas sp. RHCl1]|uniref:fosfomycin resistance glutathione transferase n=1 Tax=Thalassomonas sp. RHCl1 TaxID=2995320 RepID=UPI00248D3481|nr:fosfomycin resistance glutathione transferase [Thalassomonas sp. RHCl1]
MLTGLNHITIAVNNLPVSFNFYVNLLGMKPHAKWHSGAYLSLGELWFCLSCDVSCPAGDYSHLAFDISAADFPLIRDKLLIAGVTTWKENKSEGESLYILDPDGHKLEVHVGNLAQRPASLKLTPYSGLEFY